LLAQFFYYFAGYFQATGSNSSKVNFTVPSGNFGNVCAGHVARMMGLPIEKLVVATNENDVLDEFFRTGVYRVRGTADTHETSSPSMDISKASNFERFVFDLLGRDGEKTKDLFTTQLAKSGQFDLSKDPAFKEATSKYGFLSGKSTHSDRLNTIRSTYTDHAVMVDTHTADGLKVAKDVLKKGQAKTGTAMIVLETALPIKFATTIVEALGIEPDRPAKFEGIEALPKRVVNMPADLAQLKAFIVEKCV
jgi:threonine synthase